MKKYFANIKTADDLKKAYLELAKTHHPDKGGDPEIMKAINAEFDQMRAYFNKYGDKPYASSREEQDAGLNNIPEGLRETIFKLSSLDGIEIEICGRWLWITGETIKHKEALKEAGCRWAAKKKRWYWHAEHERKRLGREYYNMGQIRDRFGSTVVSRQAPLELN